MILRSPTNHVAEPCCSQRTPRAILPVSFSNTQSTATPTMANLFEPSRYIAVEGPIRVGKSTLSRFLATQLHGQLIQEAEENPFLSAFYDGDPGAAFQAQFAFLIRRFEQLRPLAAARNAQKIIVTDYIFEKDKLFANLNLTDPELAIYDRYYKLLRNELPTPDLVIYLQAPVDVLRQRSAGGQHRRDRLRGAQPGPPGAAPPRQRTHQGNPILPPSGRARHRQ